MRRTVRHFFTTCDLCGRKFETLTTVALRELVIEHVRAKHPVEFGLAEAAAKTPAPRNLELFPEIAQ